MLGVIFIAVFICAFVRACERLYMYMYICVCSCVCVCVCVCVFYKDILGASTGVILSFKQQL